MAFVATCIGDFFVGLAMGTSSADPGPTAIIQGVASAFVLWPFGLMIYGLIALPLTFGASLVWTWLLRAR